MGVSAIVENLELDTLPEESVNASWREGYFDEEPLIPNSLKSSVKSVDILKVLRNLSEDIFIRAEIGSLRGWPDLIEEGLDFKRFLFFINYLLCTAISHKEEEDHRTRGFFAAKVYFSFLTVPQGGPFLIYQSNIYMRSLQMLQCGDLLKAPEIPSMIRGRGRGRSRSRESFDDVESPSMRKNQIQGEEAHCLLRLLVEAQRDLIKYLRMGEVGHDGQDALLLTVDTLTNIAMQETTRSDLLAQGFHESSDYTSHCLSRNAFYGLSLLLTEKHGDVTETVRIVMRFVLDALLLGVKKDSKALSIRDTNTVRNVFIDFVRHICSMLGQTAHRGIMILMQKLCESTPERATSRAPLVESVHCLLLRLPLSFLSKSIGIFAVMSCHEKASIRLFCVEVLGRVLTDFQVDFVNNEPDNVGYKLHRLLFASVLARSEDISSLVRSKAMGCLFTHIKESSANDISRYLLIEIFEKPYLNCRTIEEVPKISFKNFNHVANKIQNEMEVTEIPLPCAQSIISQLCVFSEDPKVMVRKTALQLLLRILCLNVKFITSDILAGIGLHCRDEAVLVRKMMVQEYTALLLKYPTNQCLLKQWTMDVVPLVFDVEVTVMEKALECLELTIFNNMVQDTKMTEPKHHMPWMIVNQIIDLQLRNAILKACSAFKEDHLRSGNLIAIIKSHIGMEKLFNDSAWQTLLCLAEFMTVENPSFVLDFYHNEIRGVPNVSTNFSQLVMEVLWLTCRKLRVSDKSTLANELNDDLLLFRLPVPLISRAVDMRYFFHTGGQEGNDVRNPPEWATQLIKKCEGSIAELLKRSSGRVKEEEDMKRFIITLGNTSLYYPRIVEPHSTEQLLHMLVPPLEEPSECWTGECTGELKAALIVTLGKIGLQNEPLAKRLIDILGRLLPITCDSDVKNNCLICLTDLCIRYTSLGDEFLPDICVCLKDNLQPVRQNTLKLLIQLVQEDYIKLRNMLTFHLLSMLNDGNHIIVSMARVFFVHTVLKKKSNCFTASFVPAIFHYNGYKYRSSEAVLTLREKEVFDISGPLNREKRLNIYRFMLTHSNENNRFSISRHLCIEICKQVLDGKIKLSDSGQEVLRDCLHVMDCDEIRISDSKDADESADAPADDDDASELILNFAHKKVVSAFEKKHLVEMEIPILSKLRRKLIAVRSPLSDDVMRVLKNMITFYHIDTHDVSDLQVVNAVNRSLGTDSSQVSSDEEDNFIDDENDNE